MANDWSALQVREDLGVSDATAALAFGVPQIFTAAGNLGTRSAALDMSRVFGPGYLGLLAGSSVIGRLADLSSLATALIFPLVCAAACARIVAPSS